jgi:hypothetical protein
VEKAALSDGSWTRMSSEFAVWYIEVNGFSFLFFYRLSVLKWESTGCKRLSLSKPVRSPETLVAMVSSKTGGGSVVEFQILAKS